jgi:hypothetical protein
VAPPGNQAANREHKQVPKARDGKCRKSAVSKPVPRKGGQEGGYERFRMMHRTDIADAIVRATARPESDPDAPRTWSWVEASVWTDRMLAALGNGVRGGKWHGPMPSSLSMGFSPCRKLMFWRANPDEETANWRAVCGRTACTVRRAGRTRVLPDPYQHLS